MHVQDAEHAHGLCPRARTKGLGAALEQGPLEGGQRLQAGLLFLVLLPLPLLLCCLAMRRLTGPRAGQLPAGVLSRWSVAIGGRAPAGVPVGVWLLGQAVRWGQRRWSVPIGDALCGGCARGLRAGSLQHSVSCCVYVPHCLGTDCPQATRVQTTRDTSTQTACQYSTWYAGTGCA